MPSSYKAFYSFIVSLLMVLSFFHLAQAAEVDYTQIAAKETSLYSSDYHTTFKRIKEKVARLLDENQKLEAEYALLLQEYKIMQGRLGQVQEEIGLIERKKKQEEKLHNDQKSSVQKINEQLDMMRNDIMIRQSKKTFINNQMLEATDRMRLLRLQLEDLQYQEKELQMDLKLGEFKKEEIMRRQKGEIERYKRQLEAYRRQEKELSGQINTTSKNKENLPTEIEQLKLENERLETEVENTERQLAIKRKEVAHLKNKKLYATKAYEAAVWENEREKEKLKETVEELEDEYELINDKINSTISFKNRKRELINDVIRFDKENEELRRVIEDLRTKLRGYAY